MPKDKERSINPAQQQRKLEKAKALKKSKTELQTKRNEKLARRNPDRIQRQIDDLKALESAGDIKPREKAILADLERDLKAVQKARQSLGDKAPQYGLSRPNHNNTEHRSQRGGPGGSKRTEESTSLGKRRHNGERKHSPSGSDTDDSVRNIPWPRDTPPPVPKEFRRNRNEATQSFGERSYPAPPTVATSASARTTYESAPQIRNLTKEAVNRFVPTAVKRKQDAVKGVGGQLLEPEEMDRLEKAGYLQQQQQASQRTERSDERKEKRSLESGTIDTAELRRLEEEERRFEMEIAMHTTDEQIDDEVLGREGKTVQLQPISRHVQMEEVDDEDL